MDKVKEMKHINYNYDDLDCGTKLKRKTAIFQTKTNLNKKKNNNKTFFILEKNNNRKNNEIEIDFFDKKYFNTIKNFLIDNKFLEINYDNAWQKELNNILPSTDEFSIKEENHIKTDNEKMEIKSKNFIFENDEDVNLKDLSFKFINSNLNCLNFKNDNIEYDDKEENESEDCCSKMTNLYKDVCDSKIINDFLNHP